MYVVLHVSFVLWTKVPILLQRLHRLKAKQIENLNSRITEKVNLKRSFANIGKAGDGSSDTGAIEPDLSPATKKQAVSIGDQPPRTYFSKLRKSEDLAEMKAEPIGGNALRHLIPYFGYLGVN
jgi:hypothetical protein